MTVKRSFNAFVLVKLVHPSQIYFSTSRFVSLVPFPLPVAPLIAVEIVRQVLGTLSADPRPVLNSSVRNVAPTHFILPRRTTLLEIRAKLTSFLPFVILQLYKYNHQYPRHHCLQPRHHHKPKRDLLHLIILLHPLLLHHLSNSLKLRFWLPVNFQPPTLVLLQFQLRQRPEVQSGFMGILILRRKGKREH
jgi:hypothetical protein